MGKWSGWWEQRGYGRQKMLDLVLEVNPIGMALHWPCFDWPS